MDVKKLTAEERKLTGRKLKTLRGSGILPANIYGKNIKSLSLQVSLIEFEKIFNSVGETGIVTLEIGKEARPVLITNVQRNPKTDMPIHIDFRQVDLKEKIEANIPVTLIGESPAEKQSLGTVVLQLNEIHVEALPTDLPEKFEVNIEGLTEVDQAIYVKDLKVEKGVEVMSDLEAIVAKVEPPQKEEVIPVSTPATTGEEVSGDGQTVPTEGENPEATDDTKNSGQAA